MGRVLSPIFFACAVAIGGGPLWAQNLISNGEFASNVAGWDPWSSWASVQWNPAGAAAAGSAEVSNSRSGGVSEQTGVVQCVAVQAEAQYTLQGSIFIPSGQTGGHTAFVVLWFSAADCGGSWLGSHQTPWRNVADPSLTNRWLSESTPTKAPAGSRSAEIGLWSAKSSPDGVPLRALYDDVVFGQTAPAATLTITGPSSGYIGAPLIYTAAASGCTPQASGWIWNLGDGSGALTGTNSVTANFSVPGNYLVSVRNRGCGSAFGSKTVTVTSTPPAPLITIFGPTSGLVGQQLTFTASASGCTPDAVGWRWTVGSWVDVPETATVNLTFNEAGTFQVSVSNTACGAAVGTKTLTITAGSTANITITGPAAGSTFEIMEFSASATGCIPAPDGWTWKLDDGGTPLMSSTWPRQVASWLYPGKKTLEVSNSACDSARGTLAITITTTTDSYMLISGDGKIDPNRATVVFTHGLQEKSFSWSDLWSCVKPKSPECNDDKLEWWPGKLLANRKELNLLQFIWQKAGQVQGLEDRLEYANARQWAALAGQELADRLLANLQPPGTKYRARVHFVGHSLGTVVNARAAARFLETATSARTAQVTVLDRPDHVDVIPKRFWCATAYWPTIWCQDGFEGVYGFPRTFLATELASVANRKAGLLVDNYYSDPGAFNSVGVGDATSGIPGAKVYNHTRPRPGDSPSCPGCPENWSSGLSSPNDVGDSYFEDEQAFGLISNDHSGVHQWYRLTMDPKAVDSGICKKGVFKKPTLWHGSLNPCRQGWYWSVTGDPSAFPGTKQADFASRKEAVELKDADSMILCAQEDGPGCQASWGKEYSAHLNLPPGIVGIEVGVHVTAGTQGELVALLVDNRVQEIHAVRSGRLSEFITFGPIPIGEGAETVQIVVTGPNPASTIKARLLSLEAIVGTD